MVEYFLQLFSFKSGKLFLGYPVHDENKLQYSQAAFHVGFYVCNG